MSIDCLLQEADKALKVAISISDIMFILRHTTPDPRLSLYISYQLGIYQRQLESLGFTYCDLKPYVDHFKQINQ